MIKMFSFSTISKMVMTNSETAQIIITQAQILLCGAWDKGHAYK